MKLKLDRVRQNVQSAKTEDLLDRATVYRSEMEPDALLIIDAELVERGVTIDEIQTHLKARKPAITRSDGTFIKCSFCYKPAIRTGWGWHRLFGRIPLLPRHLAWCSEHEPRSNTTVDSPEHAA